jgi:hypothetical protein
MRKINIFTRIPAPYYIKWSPAEEQRLVRNPGEFGQVSCPFKLLLQLGQDEKASRG